MGASASVRTSHFVKVEIDPPSSAREEVQIVRVDDACVFLTPYSVKKTSAGQIDDWSPSRKPHRNAREPSALLPRIDELCGKQVPIHEVADKGKGQLLVTRARTESGGRDGSQFLIVPCIEPFSRISGICKVLGDREEPSRDHQNIAVGDFVRIGSVGLVVIETQNSLSSPAVRIKDQDLWSLKARAYSLLSHQEVPAPKDSDTGVAILPRPNPGNRTGNKASKKYSIEERSDDESDMTTEGLYPSSIASSMASSKASSHRSRRRTSVDDHENDAIEGGDNEMELCYVCCDDEEAVESNPLVSACSCTGGTRWIHLKCLERLMSGSGSGTNTACVMFHSIRRRPVCKVCCSEYVRQVKFEGPDGAIIPIPQPTLRPPYICFKVVTHSAHTRHQGSIFNTSFHVSFAGIVPPSGQNDEATFSSTNVAHGNEPFNSDPLPRAHPPAQPLPRASRPLVMGRSSDCDIPLNYQTVSGHHAALHYGGDGKFSLQDLRSSNGTFVYIKEPLPLALNQPVRVRMGRRTLKVTALAAPIFMSSLRAPATPGLDRPPPRPRHSRRIEPSLSSRVSRTTGILGKPESVAGASLAATLANVDESTFRALMSISKPGGGLQQIRRRDHSGSHLPGRQLLGASSSPHQVEDHGGGPRTATVPPDRPGRSEADAIATNDENEPIEAATVEEHKEMGIGAEENNEGDEEGSNQAVAGREFPNITATSLNEDDN